MKRLTALVRNVEYNLWDGTICELKGEEGLGVIPALLQTSQSPTQIGSTYLSHRFAPRTFTLGFAVVAKDDADQDNKRELLNYLFLADEEAMKLTFELGNEKKYYITARPYSGITFATSEKELNYQRFAVSFLANDPAFYLEEQVVERFNVGGTGTGTTVPFAVPTSVGLSTIGSAKTFINEGTLEARPVVVINGPATNLKITNITTGKVLDFTGVTLGQTQRITVDTRGRQTTVFDETGTNRLAWLTRQSDLDFSFASKRSSFQGENVIKVEGTGVNQLSEIRFFYDVPFAGI